MSLGIFALVTGVNAEYGTGFQFGADAFIHQLNKFGKAAVHKCGPLGSIFGGYFLHILRNCGKFEFIRKHLETSLAMTGQTAVENAGFKVPVNVLNFVVMLVPRFEVGAEIFCKFFRHHFGGAKVFGVGFSGGIDLGGAGVGFHIRNTVEVPVFEVDQLEIFGFAAGGFHFSIIFGDTRRNKVI